MNFRLIAAGLVAASFAAGAARADERMVPLASAGDWVALAHQQNMTSRPDVCMAGNMAHHIAFRGDTNDIEVRMFDDSWSLPADVTGQIHLSVGSYTLDLDIGDNTNSMVSAQISMDDATALFNAMDKASSMTIAAGKAKPVAVPLNGSTVVTNAFRTCLGMDSHGKVSGANPFQ